MQDMKTSPKVEEQALGKVEKMVGEPEKNKFIRILRTTPFFYALSPEEFDQIFNEIKVHRVPEESVIINEGDRGDSLFFIVEGIVRVTIHLPASRTNILLSKMQAGNFFGEHSLLTGRTRSATVTSITTGELLEIPRTVFTQVAMKYQSVRRFLVDLCCQHEKNTTVTMQSLEIDRRRFPRLSYKGKIKFQEYKQACNKKVVRISNGTLSSLSEGGLAFHVNKNQIQDDLSTLGGQLFTTKMIIEKASAPIKVLGEVINTEMAIAGGDLSGSSIVRMRFVGIDKHDRKVFNELLGTA